jgi:tetratricopeptide (TPR) repeat protein
MTRSFPLLLLAQLGAVCLLLSALLLLQASIAAAAGFAASRGFWRTTRVLGLLLRLILIRRRGLGAALAFENEVHARVQGGDVRTAKELVHARVGVNEASPSIRNAAINALIAAGAYEAALRNEPAEHLPQSLVDASALVLCQINLAEAEYNLGRWDAAEARLRPLDLASGAFDVTRAGLILQRAWIAAHRERADEALELCARVRPTWLPVEFRAEYHFTRVVALLAARRFDDAETVLREGEKAARRLSSKRNARFLRARIAAARGDWVAAEGHCRLAANHPFRTQGGDGLLLWAESLDKLARPADAAEARRLVLERDPESEAARAIAAASAAA